MFSGFVTARHVPWVVHVGSQQSLAFQRSARISGGRSGSEAPRSCWPFPGVDAGDGIIMPCGRWSATLCSYRRGTCRIGRPAASRDDGSESWVRLSIRWRKRLEKREEALRRSEYALPGDHRERQRQRHHPQPGWHASLCEPRDVAHLGYSKTSCWRGLHQISCTRMLASCAGVIDQVKTSPAHRCRGRQTPVTRTVPGDLRRRSQQSDRCTGNRGIVINLAP